MDLFLTKPGAVIAVDSPGVPVQFYMESWGDYAAFKSVITSVRVQNQSGVQYLHTLSDLAFVYVFGERMAPVSISGISFASQCENIQQQNHGLEYAMGYYLNNRISSLGEPITMVLGLSTPIVGFLDSGSFELSDTSQLIGTWSFNFIAIPQPSLLDLLG